MPIDLRSTRVSKVLLGGLATNSGAHTARNRLAYKTFVAGVLIFAGFASSSAQAQSCGALTDPAGFDQKILFGGAISSATAIAATITAANTAFLTHSSAFVSAPASPPDSQGGGVWIRGVGGESTTKSSEAIFTLSSTNQGSQPSSTNCNSTFKQTFAGV